MKDFNATGLPPSGAEPTHQDGWLRSASSRLFGATPWAMIGALLYAGLFIKPEAAGSAVVPPSIERRDLLLGATVVDKTMWLAGNFGKILNSPDNGTTWRVQASGTEAHLQDVEAWDADHAVAVGNAATVLVTSDGGASWQPVAVAHSEISSKLMRVRIGHGPGEAWAVGEMGTILHTIDFGKTWKPMRAFEDVIMSDIDPGNPDNLWVVGEYGKMFHSQDRGATWEVVKSASPASLTAIDFRDPLHALAVGLDGAMLWTADGGKTWTMVPEEKSGNHQHLFGVKWDPQRDEWLAVGAKGVWVTVSGDLGKIATGKLSSNDLSAHSKVSLAGPRAVIAGASPGVWDHKAWQTLIGK